MCGLWRWWFWISQDISGWGAICSSLMKVVLQPWFWARNQGQGVARVRTKRKPGSHITYSRECSKVWGSEPSHSQGNSHFGRWSPNGVPKLQRATLGVKTQWIVAFFILLKSPWNVDVWNGIKFLIWTSKTQVMAKRRARSQIANLTPDQKKSRIDPIYLSTNNVRHTFGKLSTRATTLL